MTGGSLKGPNEVCLHSLRVEGSLEGQRFNQIPLMNMQRRERTEDTGDLLEKFGYFPGDPLEHGIDGCGMGDVQLSKKAQETGKTSGGGGEKQVLDSADYPCEERGVGV
mmetsp:Transcript_28281/g.55362  ORF Transcript_28281/g.55362 Transcript_28281/m.55362 type:complete len:109 (+) Transcript_28281:1149-1475(+)